MNQKQIQYFLLAISMAFASTAHHLSIASSNSAPTGAAVALAAQEQDAKETREAFLLECKEKRQRYQGLVTPQDVRSVLAFEDKTRGIIEASRQQYDPMAYEQYQYTNDYNSLAAIIAGLNLSIGTQGIATLIKQYCRSITDLPYQQATCAALPIATSSPMQWRARGSFVSPNREFSVRVTDKTRKEEPPRMPIIITQAHQLKQQEFDIDVPYGGWRDVDGLWAPNSELIVLLSRQHAYYHKLEPVCIVHVPPAFSKVKLASIAVKCAPDITQWSWSPDSLLLAVPEGAGILKNGKRAINIINRQGAIQQKLAYPPVYDQVGSSRSPGVALPLAWSANNRYLAAACSLYDRKNGVDGAMYLHIFNVATGVLEKTIEYACHVACIAWADQDSILATANRESSIDIYNAQTKEQYRLNILDENGIGRYNPVITWHDRRLHIVYSDDNNLDPSPAAQVHELQPVCIASTGNELLLESTHTDELFSLMVDMNCAWRVLYLTSPHFSALVASK